LTATQLANWYAQFRYVFHPLGPHPLAGLLFLAALLGNEYRWFAAVRPALRPAAQPHLRAA
jgi:hypothetical protein